MILARFHPLISTLALAVAAACGGRTGDDGFGASTNDAGLGGFTGSGGGSAASVGYAGYAGSYGAGSPIGGNGGSFGGSISAGGVSGCQGTPCLPIGCGPGQQQVTLPGQRCPTCQGCTGSCLVLSCPSGQQLTTPPGQCCPVCTPPDPCAGVACDLLPCPSGWITVTPLGQCCPSCVPGPVDASVGPCDTFGYVQFLVKESLALDAAACATAADCTVLPPSNACGQADCGRSVNAKAAPALTEAAKQFEATSCWGCAPTAGGNCPFYAPLCVGGQCTYALPP